MAGSVIIIGSGFSGLSAATFMAKAGWRVTVIEKNSQPGGRAGQLNEAGFTFDKGPSWYWMPEVFERYFRLFGKSTSHYYDLQRLDPSYRIYWDEGFTDLPADFEALKQTFESIEYGSGEQLEKYIKEAGLKYETGMKNLVFKPGRTPAEFLNWEFMKSMMHLNLFGSMKTHVRKYFKNPKIHRILEFPVLFLGALPENTPALYSLMNYADMKGGTWYPSGGIYSVVRAMYDLALEYGVKFNFNENAEKIVVENGKAKKLITGKNEYSPDAIISSIDYHHSETFLLDPEHRSYSTSYWESRVMAPSGMIYYVGLNKKIRDLQHHSLFFDVPFDQHADEIYKSASWPSNPMFYVNASSVTEPGMALPGREGLFILIPIASGLQGDDGSTRDRYFKLIMDRIEKHLGQDITGSVIFRKAYSIKDFMVEHNAFRGNAYGLANTLGQTALLKPSCKSKRVKNLFYTGQMTVPGPGIPPCLISGEVVANELLKDHRKTTRKKSYLEPAA